MNEDIAIPIALFAGISLTVFVVMYFRWRKQRVIHETLRAMIEKGVEIPDALLAPRTQPDQDWRRGLILIAGGLGFTVFLGVVTGGEDGAWSVGLVPLFVGFGYVAAAKISLRRAERTPA